MVIVAAIWASALPSLDLPNAAGSARDAYPAHANEEFGARGYLSTRYVSMATPTASPTAEPRVEPTATPEREKFYGLATWYGAAFHGNRMRNGRPFNMYDESIAAANLWPIGSKLKVVNEDSGASIDVVVQDTGGFARPVLLDLSFAAFGLLDDHSRGMIPVIVEVISEGE